MKEGPISQWDSTTTNPPHWSGDMYQDQLNRPTIHWCQPSSLPPPPPPHPTSSHYLSFTASCISSPGANGAKNYHSPSLQSHTTYLWNQPITQVKSILQNLTPTLPAREHQLPHNQRINVAPLNASGEGSPLTANGVSNSMQQFQGTCACTHMYQWNHTCPTNGTSGTFSPHSK